ncbi:MAG: RNA 2',3'-cyclic phosphodiesterase [Phycisphaeraceae bacterium]|nr:RNA 2',3'-cyclic phosphodiesterase [Phycisphaeraceae bacterium]
MPRAFIAVTPTPGSAPAPGSMPPGSIAPGNDISGNELSSVSPRLCRGVLPAPDSGSANESAGLSASSQHAKFSLSDALTELGTMLPAVRPVPAHNLHLTLRFLGESDESLFPALLDAIKVSTAGIGPFVVHLQGLGIFPSPARPTVLWVSLQGAEPLQEIVKRLNPRVDALGFGGDLRAWQPHLTLARIKARPPQEFGSFLQRHRHAYFGSFTVHAIDLMTSQLRPQGPIYTVAGRVELGNETLPRG